MRTLTTKSEFNDYLSRVQKKADCHALNVNKILSTLAEEVLKIHPLKNGIDVRTYGKNTANIAWVNGPRGRAAFTYQSDDTDKFGQHSLIILRNRVLNGKERTHFKNGMSRSEIRAALELHL